MRILVNALSLGSLSGQHVLFGHLKQMATNADSELELVVVHQAAHREAVSQALSFENVERIEAPRPAAHWATRSIWETVTLPNWIRRYRADAYFTPAGTVLSRCPVPQVSLAQNPWCLVPLLHRTPQERLKARLQRRAYRTAVRDADCMVYNSRHIESLYHANASGVTPGNRRIVFQGIDDETHAVAAQCRGTQARRPLSILSVSAMAHWKGAETLVEALQVLHRRGVKATLDLVGPWPDANYEQSIRDAIAAAGLELAITITGKVSDAALRQHYATAQVYCLMSRCESFGIPAVEAQAFGTPVVGSNTSAMAEIGGSGGLFGPPGDPVGTADRLQSLLTDDATWKSYSDAAIQNAERFRWSICSQPLIDLFRNRFRGNANGTLTNTSGAGASS